MRLFLACVLFASLLGCASDPIPQAKDNRQAKDFSIPPRDSLIVLLPPVASEYKEFQKGEDMLLPELGKQLEQAGYKVAVLNRENYNTIWSGISTEVGGLFDPVSGASRPQAYGQALFLLTRHVCKETGCTMVIQPRIAVRSAELEGSTAVWDGRRTRIPTVHTDGREHSFTGGARSYSVALTAFTSTGAFAFQTYGGGALINAMNVAKTRSEFRRDLFNSDRDIAEGVRIALAPLKATQP